MQFHSHMGDGLKQMSCSRAEVVICKNGMEVSEWRSVLVSCKVSLQRDELRPLLDRLAVIHMLIVHVPVFDLPHPANSTCDGRCLKVECLGQSMQRRVDFLTRVKPNEHIIPAAREIHGLLT